jgi:hypothetical protein
MIYLSHILLHSKSSHVISDFGLSTFILFAMQNQATSLLSSINSVSRSYIMATLGCQLNWIEKKLVQETSGCICNVISRI